MSYRNKCSHDDNRRKVCAPCGRKITFGKTKPEKLLIKTKVESLIKKFMCEDFNIANEKYPLGICWTCYVTLLDFEKNIFNRQLPTMPNYNDMVLQRMTRSVDMLNCDCYICSTATYFGHVKEKKGKGNFKALQLNVDVSDKNAFAEQKEQVSNSKDALQLVCGKCFLQVGKGIRHDCKKPQENLLKLVKQLPEKNQEQLISSFIQEKCDSAIDKNREGIHLNLATSGRQKRIIVNNSLKKDLSFKEENLDNLRVKLGVSQNQMKKITNFVRCNVGRKSIPANYNQHMSQASKVLKDLYKVSLYKFDCEKISDKQERPVVYADAEELLDTIIEKRNFTGNCIVKVMADGGQGFFKVSLTILPENYSPHSNFEGSENDDFTLDDINQCKKRALYSEGGSIGKKCKLSSVHKLILLCIVPQIKESYDNVKLLFDLTKINNISFKFVADFKLLLIINGQQTATSMYPCPYCFVSLNDLKSDSVSEVSSDVTCENSMDSSKNNCMELKTFGDLRADCQNYCDKGKDKKLSKECHSTINLPLFAEDDNILVLQKCIIPELHILQGFVNHVFWKGLVNLVGREKALLWPKKLNLISKNYHGDAFEGNACRMLLKEADKLKDSEIYQAVGIFKIIPYINAFNAMNKIVNCCFTSGKVGPSLDDHIKELDYALKSIQKLSRTLKIHIILTHIKESLLFIENNNGLGFWSEQSGEAVHHDFLKFWENYKVTSMHHESYSTQLLKAVTEFSSLHI